MPDPLEGLIRESSRQNQGNLRALGDLAAYWDESPGSANVKLENFAKYTTRESLTKFLTRQEVFLKQLTVNGSIVEMGVARGASLLTWYHLSSIYEPTNYLREIIGFDTFSGFPEISERDQLGSDVSEHTKAGGFAVEGGMDDDILRAAGIHDATRFLGHIPKLKLVKGDLTKTLPQYLADNPHLVVSLLHLDVDLYEPTKLTLELLLPRMPKGAVIMFDELNMRQFPGETLAAMDAVGIPKLRLQRFPYATCMSYAVIE
jgi:hypothetical protein